MFKLLVKFVITLAVLSLFSGCVSKNARMQPTTYPKPIVHDKNDVDTSDIEEKITESKTVITQENPNLLVKRTAFRSSEYNVLPRSGKATVKGQIYLKDLYGEKVLGSHTKLYLNPITSYSKQWYRESYLGGKRMEKADKRLFNYLRFTAADEDGNFAFYGVPSASYYLIGTVKCAEECGYSRLKSVRIVAEVSVRGNQVLHKNLTKKTK